MLQRGQDPGQISNLDPEVVSHSQDSEQSTDAEIRTKFPPDTPPRQLRSEHSEGPDTQSHEQQVDLVSLSVTGTGGLAYSSSENLLLLQARIYIAQIIGLQ